MIKKDDLPLNVDECLFKVDLSPFQANKYPSMQGHANDDLVAFPDVINIY